MFRQLSSLARVTSRCSVGRHFALTAPKRPALLQPTTSWTQDEKWTPIRSFSSPALRSTQEIVQVVTLNNISDNPGAVKKKRRVGRGIGSSKGKTCGRGHKGQNARSGGGVRPTFEGGQTPLFKRLPKRGFSNKRHGEHMLAINLGTLQDYIDMGRLATCQPNGEPLTMRDLLDAGVCGSKFSQIKNQGMKLLAHGKERLRSPLKLHISRASQSAIEALEAVGGSVTTVHYNRLALRVLMNPERFEGKLVPKQAKPPPKRMQYYTDYENRGYLSLEKQLETKLKIDPNELLLKGEEANASQLT